MKKLLTLAILTITGCATAASYNNTCFQENDDFGSAVNCTKGKMSDDPRVHIPTNAKFVSSLYPFMDMVTNEVETGKMSPAQGQYLIAEKINQLTNSQKVEWNALGTAISEMGQTNSQKNNKECTSLSIPPFGSIGCKNVCIDGKWAEIC